MLAIHNVLLLNSYARLIRCTSSVGVPCRTCNRVVVEYLTGKELQTGREIRYRPNQVLTQFPHNSHLVGSPCRTRGCAEYCIPIKPEPQLA